MGGAPSWRLCTSWWSYGVGGSATWSRLKCFAVTFSRRRSPESSHVEMAATRSRRHARAHGTLTACGAQSSRWCRGGRTADCAPEPSFGAAVELTTGEISAQMRCSSARRSIRCITVLARIDSTKPCPAELDPFASRSSSSGRSPSGCSEARSRRSGARSAAWSARRSPPVPRPRSRRPCAAGAPSGRTVKILAQLIFLVYFCPAGYASSDRVRLYLSPRTTPPGYKDRVVRPWTI